MTRLKHKHIVSVLIATLTTAFAWGIYQLNQNLELISPMPDVEYIYLGCGILFFYTLTLSS